MNYEIKNKEEYKLHIESDKEGKVALLLHGYGGSKEEMLPLANGLAKKNISSTIIDLPGHGRREDIFNYGSLKKSVDLELRDMPADCIVVGHSLGALMASSDDRKSVLISPPLNLYFEGEKRELLKVLRVRNVKEESYFSGLMSVLENIEFQVERSSSLIVYGGNDLQTVLDYAKKAESEGIEIQSIINADHLNILAALELPVIVGNWINGFNDE